MAFFRKAAEAIGKAIPNEFSKLNSFSKFIPGVGPYLQAISAVDSGATAYGDTGNIGAGIGAGFNGYMGSTDPGQYGSQGHVNNDIFNRIGQIGNFIPSKNPMSMSGGTNQQFLTTDQLAYQNRANGIGDKSSIRSIIAILSKQHGNDSAINAYNQVLNANDTSELSPFARPVNSIKTPWVPQIIMPAYQQEYSFLPPNRMGF